MNSELSFKEFLGRRGYKTPMIVSNVVWRWFFESFTQPAFGGFWRVWNPFFGYYLSRLYRKFGGDRNRFFACVLTFAVFGLFHDFMCRIMDSPHQMRLKAMFAFMIFGLFVAVTSPLRFQRLLRKLSRFLNVLRNIGHIFFGYFCAHRLWKLTEHALIVQAAVAP